MARYLSGDDDATFDVKETELGLDQADAGATYTLRPLTRDVVKRFVKAHTSRVRNEERMNNAAFNEDCLDYCIVAWRGIRDIRTKEDAPCTREWKLRLDGFVSQALMQRAGVNQLQADEADRLESFRGA